MRNDAEILVFIENIAILNIGISRNMVYFINFNADIFVIFLLYFFYISVIFLLYFCYIFVIL